MSLLNSLANVRIPKGPWGLGHATDDNGRKVGLMLATGLSIAEHPETKKMVEVQTGIVFVSVDVQHLNPPTVDTIFKLFCAIPDMIDLAFQLSTLVGQLVQVVGALKHLPGIAPELVRDIDKMIETAEVLIHTNGEPAPQPSQIIIPS